MGCSRQGGRTGYDIQYSSTDVRVGHKEGWEPKKWCFSTVVPEKTLESPLGSKEMKPVNPKGNQSWKHSERTDAEAEAQILWPPGMKSRLIGKDPDAGKNWGQEEKKAPEDETVGWHRWINGLEFEQTLGDSEGQGSLACCSSRGRKELDTAQQVNNNNWSNSSIHGFIDT